MPVPKPSQMIETVAIQSSLLAFVSYDSRKENLQVTFCSGAAYQYDGVPAEIYRGLLQADSKGAYFNQFIRGVYVYNLLTPPSASG